MSKKRVFVLIFAMTMVALPLAANALGLGEIKLNSALNQPFSADIPIVGAAPGELSSLHVKVASAAQFQQAGIPMSGALSQLQFQIVQGPNGTASVHITSSKAFREPFVDMLVDATWDNGELLREYTVFLNPPNFESTSPSAPAPAAVAPAPTASAPVGVPTSVPSQAPTSTQPTQSQTTVPAVAPAVSTVNTSLGGNYGPIHRGETLSEIALRLRPQGVTLNQMMIAIYRANPEVFMHNINLMKAGYVLRVPNADDIQAVQVADANAEVRAQISAWRSSRGLAVTHKTPSAPAAEQPSLQLVAPSSAAQTSENQVPGTGQGSSGVSAASKASSAASKVAAVATKTARQAGTAAAVSTTARAPIAVANNSLAAVQGQASKESKQAAETKVTPLVPEKPAVIKPLPKPKVVPVESTESNGLFSSTTSWVVIILIIIVIVLIIITVIKKKKSGSTPPTSKIIKSKIKTSPTVEADWEEEEKAGLKDVTASPATGARSKSSAVTGALAGAAATGAAALGMTTTTLKPGEADPVAEADFHMAYGLYDQAAGVLKKAISQDPGRQDLKKKLLEVYFTAGDRANFVATARELHAEMSAQPGSDWENIAIMGRQVAADDPLFSGDGAAMGRAGSSVDIPLDSGGTGTSVATDLDPLAGAFDEMRPVTIPAAEETAAVDTGHQALDFSLPDIEPDTIKPKAAAVNEATVTGTKKTAKSGVSTVTADFGTDSQVEFDKALKELSDFVNTNVPPQDEGTRSGAALSLAADADVVSTSIGTGSATGTGEETTGLNEIGTKLDLARAYIDMGDSEGAKNILQEVLAEGDTQQKLEAQKLMQNLA